MTFFIQKL